jgi:hypothetical protein
MPLRIIRSSDPISVEHLVLCLYGPPGVGKSSLGFTAEDSLLLDFDAGAYRAANRGDSVPVKTWADVTGITAADLEGYRTIVVDTAGRALDILSADIINRDPKMGRGGALSLQGFGKLKAEFTAWLKMLRSFGADVVLLAHADEQRSGDDVVERIDAQGSSKNEIYKVADAMGRIAIRNGKRMLLFSPTETAFGKNPAALDAIEIPSFTSNPRFLGDVIHRIKGKLNEMTAEQSECAALLSAWADTVTKTTTPKGMTDLIPEIDKLDSRIRENAKRVLWDHAKGHDFTYDAKKKQFAEKQEKAS